jgi:hypothetical protein
MANPYKKADQKPKAAPGSKRPLAPVVEETPVVEVPVAPVVETPVEVAPVVNTPVATTPVVETPKAKPTPKKEEPKDDIEDLFPDLVEEKPTGKPKTLYLDAEVVDVLEKLAKKKKMSTSKVANAILRNALIGK